MTPLPRTAASGAHLAAARQNQTDESLFRRLLHSNSWSELRYVAELLLGPEAFDLGVCTGILKNLAAAVSQLLGFLTMLILNGLYERGTHPPPFWDVLDLPDYWEARLAQAVIGQQMRHAHHRVQAMKREIRQIMHDPLAFFSSIGTHLKAEYVGKWNRYLQLSQDTAPSHQFEAGEIFGEVLAEVVLTILAVLDGVGVVAKIAARVPELLRVVESVRAAEAARDASGAADALDALEQAGAARRLQSYQDLDAYQQRNAALRDQARQAGENRRGGGYQAKVTEAVGERGATQYMQTNEPDFVMDRGFQPGTGFDQVYTKYDADGNPTEMRIIEAKGPGAELSTTAAKGPQMSQQWTQNTVNEMMQSSNPDTQALGQRLNEAMQDGDPPVTGQVLQTNSSGVTRVVPGPNGSVYTYN